MDSASLSPSYLISLVYPYLALIFGVFAPLFTTFMNTFLREQHLEPPKIHLHFARISVNIYYLLVYQILGAKDIMNPFSAKDEDESTQCQR